MGTGTRLDITAIKAANPLLDLVSMQTGERGDKSGAWTMFYCPFHTHNHDTPSLGVIEDHWKCFGCGEHGDVIDFAMRVHGLDFKAACERLGAGFMPGEALKTVMEAREKRQAAEAQAAKDARDAWEARQPWIACHKQLGPAQRLWWNSRGVPDEWQDRWQLGFTPDRPFKFKDELLHSPAYTIPYLRKDAPPVTLQYRLISFPAGAGKYRFESKLGRSYFLADPERGLRGPGLIVEGAAKAMVTYLKTNKAVQVIGLPSKSDFAGLETALRGSLDAWWIILDPDAFHRPQGASEGEWEPSPVKLARAIGAKAKVLQLPGKLDDMFLAKEKPLDLSCFKWLLEHCGRSFAV